MFRSGPIPGAQLPAYHSRIVRLAWVPSASAPNSGMNRSSRRPALFDIVNRPQAKAGLPLERHQVVAVALEAPGKGQLQEADLDGSWATARWRAPARPRRW